MLIIYIYLNTINRNKQIPRAGGNVRTGVGTGISSVSDLLGGEEFQDFGDDQFGGVVGVETVLTLEVGVLVVVGKVFFLAVDGVVVCGEEGEDLIARIFVLADNAELGIKFAGLHLLIFLDKLVGDLEILQSVAPWIMKRQSLTDIFAELAAGMEAGIDENPAESAKHLREHATHRRTHNHGIGLQLRRELLELRYGDLGLHSQVRSDYLMLG